MPRFVSEITSGAQFTRSRENGVVADSQVRTFRVMLDQPGEYLDIQSACEIRIGDRHPSNTNIICQSFSAQYDGESRMVIVCTFNYGSEADAASSGGGGDGGVAAGRRQTSAPPTGRCPRRWSRFRCICGNRSATTRWQAPRSGSRRQTLPATATTASPEWSRW